MKTFLFIALALTSVTMLSACKTSVEGRGYEVEVQDGSHHGNGDFCPPGQAKKGNC